jgi:LEA14-like dessication related protein
MRNEQHATCNLVGWARFSDGRRERGKLVLAFTGDFPIFWKPDIYLLPLQVRALTIGGADLRFEVKFANKNRYELFMNRISYHLEIAGHLVDQRTISGDKNIEKHGEKVFSIPVLLNFFEVGKGISNNLKQASVRCRFWGDVDIQTIWGKLTVPFDISDLLSIKRAP